jgi:[ribosomal protein S18]-alanine N-acetyltransferase
MICSDMIQLAGISDAVCIAEMSRDLIEAGLGWSWTPSRLVRAVRRNDTNVIVTRESGQVIAFAVMRYLDDEARLDLFGVLPQHRRKGVGTRMVRWLEETALCNGTGVVYLETRVSNRAARAFYQSLGYQVTQQIPGYYRGIETAVRLAHDLWDGNEAK